MIYADNIPVGELIPVNSVQTQTLVTNQCLSLTNSCKLNNRICIPKRLGGYVCGACLSGYIDENGICKKPCATELNECSAQEICNDSIKPGTALCISGTNEDLPGLVICDEYDFNGNCFNSTESITSEYLMSYEISFSLQKGWEAYFCDYDYYCEHYIAEDTAITGNVTSLYVNQIIIQPKDETEFRNFYTNSDIPYAKIYNNSGKGVVFSEWDNNTESYFNPSNITAVSVDSNYMLFVSDEFGAAFFLDTQYLEVIPEFDFGNNNSNTRYTVNWDDFGITGLYEFKLIKKIDLDLSDINQGAVFCNYADELCYHRTNHTTFSANDPYNSTVATQPNYLGSNILSNGNNINLLYVAPGWEAYLCKGIDDTLQNCNYISETGKVFSFYENFKKIYIQPATQDAKYEYLQDKEFIEVFDKPGYRGNSIIFSGTRRYNNPISPVASLKKSSPFIRSYLRNTNQDEDLSKKYVEESETIPYDIETIRWKYIETEQAQNGLFYTDPYSLEDGIRIKFNFHCPQGDPNCGGKPARKTNNEFKDCSRDDNCQNNEDCPNCKNNTYCDLNTNLCTYYPTERILYSETENFNLYPYAVATGKEGTINSLPYSAYNLNNTAITFVRDGIDVSINNSWEMYICSTDSTKDCIKFSNPNNAIITSPFKSIMAPFGNAVIKTIFVQPKKHNKITQYLGFSEYKEDGIGNKGYVELFDEENYEGNRFILTNRQYAYDLKYTPMKSGKIKSIHVVGSVRPIVKKYNSTNEFYLPRHDVDENSNGYEYITLSPTAPSVLISNAHDTPATYSARGMFDNVPKFASKRYLFNTEITKDKIREFSDSSFYGDQDKYYDGSDLVFVTAHGNWSNGNGSSQNLDNNNNVWSDMYNRSLGGSIGDAQTEWYLAVSCESLGKVECLDGGLTHSEMCDCIEQYGGMCLSNGHPQYNYNALPKTSSAEAINGYKEVFKNGLHGVGGYYRDSWWDGSSNYSWMGLYFWLYTQGIKLRYVNGIPYYSECTPFTIGEAWRKVFYKEDDLLVGIRYAGYIAPEKCSDYVHNDHFWGTGETLPDPDMDYIIKNGFCYFSKSSATDTHFTFEQVIPWNEKDDWMVFNLYMAPSGVTSAMAQYFENSEGVVIEDVTGDGTSFSYAEANRKGRLPINIQTNDFHPEIDDKTYDYEVYKYYGNAYAFIQDKIAPYMSQDLILGDVKVSYGLEQHFDYDGNRLEAEIDEFQYTFRYHSGTGYFPERNYITISYNAATDKMVGIDIVFDNLVKTEETVKGTTILYDLEIAKTNNPNNSFFVAYSLVNGSYRPAIYKMNTDNEAEVFKQY